MFEHSITNWQNIKELKSKRLISLEMTWNIYVRKIKSKKDKINNKFEFKWGA